MADNIQDLIARCSASRNARRDRYAKLREWALRGTESGVQPVRYNKLRSHLDLLTSYLYAPEGTRFYLALPAEQQKDWEEHADVARTVFLRRWRDSGADVLFGQIVEWALAYSTTIAKLRPLHDEEVDVAYVAPQDFGVLREDVPFLDKQDAMTHHFALSVPEVKRLVRGHAQETKIVAWADQQASPGSDTSTMPAMVQQVIVSNVTGSFPSQQESGLVALGLPGDERPEVQEPLCECVEVWEKVDFKDKKGRTFVDYLVTTTIGEWSILERRNPVLPHVQGTPGIESGWESENPFVKVTPKPLLDYFWGTSELQQLLALQQWRESRMGQLDLMYKKQLDPPRFFSGMPLSEDKLKGLSHPGGFVASPMPGGKMDLIQIPAPTNPLELIHEIDREFADSSGLPPILATGEGENIRSDRQGGGAARIASGRVAKTAAVVEDSLEVLATRMFHLMQRRDGQDYRLPNGKPFLLSHLPSATTIKVSAHSASPVYAEQIAQKAFALFKAGALDMPSLVELVDPPGMETLRDKARELQKQKAEMMKERLRIEEMKAARRGR